MPPLLRGQRLLAVILASPLMWAGFVDQSDLAIAIAIGDQMLFILSAPRAPLKGRQRTILEPAAPRPYDEGTLTGGAEAMSAGDGG